MNFNLDLTRLASASIVGLLSFNNASAEQPLLEFYGLLDVAMGHQSKGLPPDANNTASIVPAVYANASNPRVASKIGRAHV